MNQEVLDTLTRARTALIIDQPFYGMLALRLKFVEDASKKTMEVDGTTIAYNPAFVKSLPIGQVKTVLAHEVMHCVYAHFARRGDRDPRRFNVAGDHVINLGLKKEKFEEVPGWPYDPQYEGMTTDHVYSLLPEDSKDDPIDNCADGGEQDPMEELEWKMATVQAAKVAEQEGKLPQTLKRFVDELTQPKVDWRAMLRRFITEISKDDYSWMRPNKRFQALGFFLPSLYSETMGEIAVVIDTSGSIDQPTLNEFGAEIKAIVANVRPAKTHVIYCDSRVNHVDVFDPNDELKFEAHGGGDTDFRPPFRYLEQNDIRPVCLVYLTDLYGPTGESPGFPVLWACTTDKVAPWGETVPIRV